MTTAVRPWMLVTLLLITFFAFSSAIRAPWQFDDHPSIRLNPTIRDLAAVHTVLSPPVNTSVTGRPAVNVSLAMNYAFNSAFGIDARNPNATISYHVVNIAFHLLSGLLLFGILWRTLSHVGQPVGVEPRVLAAIITSIWLLHPIHTEAVNYVVQRTELMVSVCYLATLYVSIRAWGAKQPLWWYTIGVVVCVIGMFSKEVMISAPLIVVLYDRAFRVSSWKALVQAQSRSLFYVLLGASAGIVLYSVAMSARHDTVGFNLGITWYEYLYTQAWAIARYVQLLFWPSGLTFDYGERAITGWRGVPGAILLSAALFVTLYAWTRRHLLWLGFLGAWFFLLLAPSSSVVPIRTEVAAERRIYLASVAILILAVLGGNILRKRFRMSSRVAVGVVMTVSGVLAISTFVRGFAYESTETLYRDVIAKQPDNPRAYVGVGLTLMANGPEDFPEARQLLRRAVALDSNYVGVWQSLGLMAVFEQRWPDAIFAYQHALRLRPQNMDAVEGMARALLGEERANEAKVYVDRLASPDVDLINELASQLIEAGENDNAIRYLNSISATHPPAMTLALLSLALANSHRAEDARVVGRAAAERAGDTAAVYRTLVRASLTAGHAGDAETYLRKVVKLDPKDQTASNALLVLERKVGR